MMGKATAMTCLLTLIKICTVFTMTRIEQWHDYNMYTREPVLFVGWEFTVGTKKSCGWYQ